MITLIYYTANRITPWFASAVQQEHLKVAGDRPIVSVSREPITFGSVRVVVGETWGSPSIYGVYRQVLEGARLAETPFVSMIEDDSLYVPEHFDFRPSDDRCFYYNRNRWVITRQLSADKRRREAVFYWRSRTQMAQLICRRDLLIETLTEKFARYPEPVPDQVAYKTGWGEPGRYESLLGLKSRRRAYFETPRPNVTFNHKESLRGRRAVQETDQIARVLDPWGDADALWTRIHG